MYTYAGDSQILTLRWNPLYLSSKIIPSQSDFQQKHFVSTESKDSVHFIMEYIPYTVTVIYVHLCWRLSNPHLKVKPTLSILHLKKNHQSEWFSTETLKYWKQGQYTFYYRIHSLHRNCDICTLILETLKSSP